MSPFRRPAALCLAAALVWLSIGWFVPERRVARYVEAHQTELQTSMDRYFEQCQPLSYGGGILTANDWPGRYPMVEYILFTAGSGYYGFCYSPDDVPLAFQNAAVPLVETADGWQWQGEGESRGFTRRLSPAGFIGRPTFKRKGPARRQVLPFTFFSSRSPSGGRFPPPSAGPPGS